MQEDLTIESKARGDTSLRSWLFLFSCNLMWALQFTRIKLLHAQLAL